MSLCRMVYVVCDNCGRPADGESDMCDTAPEARERAIALGFERRTRGRGRPIDLCPVCQ